MRTVQDVHSDWKITCAEPAHGEHQDFHKKPFSGTMLWEAAVPGDIHLDLMKAGFIPDPFFADNYDHCLWMEDKEWWYETNLTAPEMKPGQSLFLVFEGLDTLATVYLNGEVIGRHENMFTPLRINLTGKLDGSENRLAVCLAPLAADARVRINPKNLGFGPRRLFFRKAQSCFGWDIAPRIVTVGIWQPVRLVVCDEAEIEFVNIQTLSATAELARVEAEVGLIHHAPSEPLTIKINLAGQELTLTAPAEAAGASSVKAIFEIQNPKLWWPHNHGEPALHDCSVTLSLGDKKLDERSSRFGIRTVEMVQEPQGEGKTSFYFKVNGKPVFLKGMNWTPCDSIYPRADRDRYEKLITFARENNINTLRVWGGGIYESDWFYELCDREGILIWQDFMFACGFYPYDEPFMEAVREEAEVVVKRLRSHPSLLVWCGDNEDDWIYMMHFGKDFYKNPINRWCLPNVCSRLDPLRPYVKSSPFSPSDDMDPNSPDAGDAHLWYHGHSYKSENYMNVRPRMVTEMGHLALPDMDIVKTFIPENCLWPMDNEPWRSHSSDPIRLGWGHYRINSLYDSIKAAGLEKPETLEDMIEKTQRLQAEATRCWVETYSSDPGCWGVLLWNLADGWPQISDAYIAYPFAPKAAMAVVKEAFGKIER